MLWLDEAQAALKGASPSFILGLVVAGAAFAWWVLERGAVASESVRIFVGT